MEPKQIWLIVLISLIVSIIVSVVVVNISERNLLTSPGIGNTPTKPGSIEPTPVPRPDLTSQITIMNQSCYTYNYTRLCSLHYGVYVRNIGNAVAGSSLLKTGLTGPTLKVSYFNVTGLQPSQGQYFNVGYFNLLSGNYTVYSNADWLNQVQESNENNNADNIFLFLY